MDHQKEQLKELLATIQQDLDRSVDFWLKHSHDDLHGGFFSCLGSDGKRYDDLKYGWLQGRQVWMYAHLYMESQRFHKKEILDAAEKGGEFLMKHIKGDPKCFFIVTRDGKPVKVQRTIFTEVFYTMAMAALARATGKESYKKEALFMMERICHWVFVDDTNLGSPKYSGVTKTNSMAVPMMILCLVETLITMDTKLADEYQTTSAWAVSQIKMHLQREGSVVLEHVGLDGEELSGCQGRLMIPGHAIECGWFLLQHAARKNDKNLQRYAIDNFIVKPFEYGWDDKHGGLFYFLDADGLSPMQLEWSQKLWWPHAESMIAFLMAYEVTNDAKHLQKFRQVFDYTYSHFCDNKHGEWLGYLHQDGSVNMDFKGGSFKGCFHVPRCLLICEEILKGLISKLQ